MKKMGIYLLYGFLYLFCAYLISVMVGTFMEFGEFYFGPEAFTNSSTMSVFPLVLLGGSLIFLPKLVDAKPKNSNSRTSSKGKDEDGKETDQYFSNRFTTAKEFKTDSSLGFTLFSNLKNVEKDGLIVRAERVKNDIEINIIDPIHALMIGTTGSGKSTQYLEPFVQIMSKVKSKPSFIISDPKGEISEHNVTQLRKEGYQVVVYDLDNPFNSIKWNPMSSAWEKYHRAQKIEKELKSHPAGDKVPKNITKTNQFDEMKQGWYEFDRKAYIDKNIMFDDMRVKSMSLVSESFQELEDFSQCICPIKDKNNPSWEQAAQNFILGCCIAMLEDSLDPRLGMTKEKFVPYNLAKMCNHKSENKDQYNSLKKYFEKRDTFSKVPQLISTALLNSESTTRNYMGFVTNAVKMFTEMGIILCTSKTELDFRHFSRKPTAFFIKVPDYIHTRDPLATLCFSQIYKKLVEEAMNNPKPGSTTKTLERHVYFLLDEFANLPPFPSFNSTISVARSRGIFFVLAVQSFSQLNVAYGDADAKVIRDNTNVTLYMGTDDLPTNEEFSKKMGNKTIEMTNINKTKGDGKESASSSESKQSVSIPLVEPLALQTQIGPNGNFNIFITYYKFKHPIKSVFTPYFNAFDIYDISSPTIPYIGKQPFDERTIAYNIEDRNKIVIGSTTSSSNDDPFNLFG